MRVEVLPPSEWSAGMTLLAPLAREHRLPPFAVGARLQAHPERLVGAAAFVPQLAGQRADAFKALVKVLPRWQRQGIGRALIHRLRQEAAAWNIPRLLSLAPLPAGASTAFVQALGARRSLAMHHYLAETVATLPLMRSLLSKMHHRGRIPPNHCVVPLSDAPIDAVAALHAAYFGQSTASSTAALTQALDNEPGRSMSFAVWNGQRVAGALIAGGSPDLPRVDYWFSAPDFQHGWVALLTLAAFVEEAAARGITHGRFSCNEHTRATLNIARKVGAKLESLEYQWEIEVFAPG